jgi:hypothetical protein
VDPTASQLNGRPLSAAAYIVKILLTFSTTWFTAGDVGPPKDIEAMDGQPVLAALCATQFIPEMLDGN